VAAVSLDPPDSEPDQRGCRGAYHCKRDPIIVDDLAAVVWHSGMVGWMRKAAREYAEGRKYSSESEDYFGYAVIQVVEAWPDLVAKAPCRCAVISLVRKRYRWALIDAHRTMQQSRRKELGLKGGSRAHREEFMTDVLARFFKHDGQVAGTDGLPYPRCDVDLEDMMRIAEHEWEEQGGDAAEIARFAKMFAADTLYPKYVPRRYEQMERLLTLRATGATYNEVAEAMGLSSCRISQLLNDLRRLILSESPTARSLKRVRDREIKKPPDRKGRGA
jgi:hypothetical protein